MGTYLSEEEALSLIIWRAYDCGVNGVSDAVHHSTIGGKKQIMQQSKYHKLKWLKDNSLLPLQDH